MAINVKDIANEVALTGVVAGYKIEKKQVEARWDSNDFKKGDKVDAHNGYFTIQTGDNQFATVNVRDRIVSFYNGEMDNTSKALEAMANEEVDTYFKTKDLTQTPVISAWGKDKQGHTNLKMVDNYYYGQSGELVENYRVELGFAKISLGDPKEDPRFDNEVVLNGLVEDIKPEISKATDEETGRAIVTMSIPYTYGSKDHQVIRCIKTQFVAGVVEIEENGEIETFDLGAELLNYPDDVLGFSWEAVVELNGYTVETETEVEEHEEGGRRGFGRKRKTVNTNRTTVREMLLVGLNQLGDGEVFDAEDIRDAFNLRQADIASALKKWEEKQNEPKQETTGGARRGSFRANANTTSTEAPKSEGTATGATTRNRFRR